MAERPYAESAVRNATPILEVLGREFTVVGLTRETSSWMSPYIFIKQEIAEKLLQTPGSASFYLLQLPEDADVTTTCLLYTSDAADDN